MSAETEAKWVGRGYSPMAEWAILRYASGEEKYQTLSFLEAFGEMLSHGWCQGEVPSANCARCMSEPDQLLVGKWLQFHGFSCQFFTRTDTADIMEELRLNRYVIIRLESGSYAKKMLNAEQSSVALWGLEKGNVHYYDAFKEKVRTIKWEQIVLPSSAKWWSVRPPSAQMEGVNTGKVVNPYQKKISEIKKYYSDWVTILRELKVDNQPVFERCQNEADSFAFYYQDIDILRVAVCGHAKRGKSAFINALLGIKDLVEEDFRKRTSVIVRIAHSKEEGAAPTYQVVDRKWQKWEVDEHEAKKMIAAENERKIISAYVSCSSPLLKNLRMELVDTPGLDSFYQETVKYQLETAPRWDAVLYVLDSGESPLTDSDIRQIKGYEEKGIPVGVIQTSKDTVSEQYTQEIGSHNLDRLTLEGVAKKLSYHKVDSSLRFHRHDEPCGQWVADLVHSGFPSLLYKLNTELLSVRSEIRDNQMKALDECLKRVRAEVERKIRELRICAGNPDLIPKVKSRLQEHLEAKRNEWLMNRYSPEACSQELNKLKKAREKETIGEVLAFFRLEDLKQNFQKEAEDIERLVIDEVLSLRCEIKEIDADEKSFTEKVQKYLRRVLRDHQQEVKTLVDVCFHKDPSIIFKEIIVPVLDYLVSNMPLKHLQETRAEAYEECVRRANKIKDEAAHIMDSVIKMSIENNIENRLEDENADKVNKNMLSKLNVYNSADEQ